MEKKFKIRDFNTQLYYCGDVYGWRKEGYYAESFDTLEDAEKILEQLMGEYQIEEVYTVY